MNEKNLSSFNGTDAQEKQLMEVIEKHRNQQGGLMPILQEAQGIYGYLPEEVQKMITGSVSSTVFVIASNLVFLLYFRMWRYSPSLCPKTSP